MEHATPQKSITNPVVNGGADNRVPVSSISTNITVADSLDIKINVGTRSKAPETIYSQIPKRYKLGAPQFEVLFPLMTEYDGVASSFGAFEKQEVFVEFSTYRNFILDNFEEEFQHVIFGDELTYRHATVLGQIFNPLRLHIENMSAQGGSQSIASMHESMNLNFKKKFAPFIQTRKESLTELWQSFVLNVAMLNVKSVILCGEYAETKLKGTNKQVVPIKFIPKLGSELDILFKLDSLTMDEIKERMNTDQLISHYGKNVFISSLPSSEIGNLMDSNLEGKPVYVTDIAEKYGYSQRRYENAEHVIRTRASKSEADIESCELYLNEMLEFIDTLGALYSELKHINQGGKNCIVTDFDFNKGYHFNR